MNKPWSFVLIETDQGRGKGFIPRFMSHGKSNIPIQVPSRTILDTTQETNNPRNSRMVYSHHPRRLLGKSYG